MDHLTLNPPKYKRNGITMNDMNIYCFNYNGLCEEDKCMCPESPRLTCSKCQNVINGRTIRIEKPVCVDCKTKQRKEYNKKYKKVVDKSDLTTHRE